MIKASTITAATGKSTEVFCLQNRCRMMVEIMAYRGIISKLIVPDRHGQATDIALGYDNFDDYLSDQDSFIGAVVGRYANRIAGGQFSVHGQIYHLEKNNGQHCLHGGSGGMNTATWQPSTIENSVENNANQQLRLFYLSPAGEQGFPGELATTVCYTLLADENMLLINYYAESSCPTYVNLTHHGYFNLSGAGKGDILQHQLIINADHYLPTDGEQIPTGDIRSVGGTPFDFRQPKLIGADMAMADSQLTMAGGYDHNFVLNASSSAGSLAAKVFSPDSGIVMALTTTQPGLQFYSGNYLGRMPTGKSGSHYPRHSGFCLETQHFPDGMHHKDFIVGRCSPKQPYRQQAGFHFSTEATDQVA